MNQEVLSALIGMIGAVNNSVKTEQTDRVLRESLVNNSDPAMVELIHKEKFSISPNCESCQSPCGNTSDYPQEKYELWPAKQRELKEKVLDEVIRIAKTIDEGVELPELIYRAIEYVGYNLEDESYVKLLEELKLW